ncbi:MAG: hypothetical protein K6E50_13390 [Lachnospiraceae bacterium]|nr:hypothetical protein [Lachnospiraceae bacterium]
MNKKTIGKLVVAVMLTALCGCGSREVPEGTGGMVKVGSYNVEEEIFLSDESGTEELLDTFLSDDGLCEIKRYASYYDVTLDYEKSSPEEVGAAYAKTILEAVPDYAAFFDPYLHENLRSVFLGRPANYASLEERVLTLEASIPEDYRREIESFARTLSGGEEGYEEDGKLSYIEALTMQMIPDALRGTACSALSLGGSRTVTGERITMRNLEWNLGSEAQMTKIHAVMHMKKHERSLTAISILGILDMITAVNDDGVMIAILDVGSGTGAAEGMPFVYEGKKCYTHEIRHALEEFRTAREAGEFLLAESGDFTWCNNLLVTDSKDAFCCENATREVREAGKAVSVLRSADTELMEGLEWDSADALCIVNSFATKGNRDSFTGVNSNTDRFAKYNKWVSEKDRFSVADVKGLMSKEVVEQHEVLNVHNAGTVHTVIVDYASGDIHVAFTQGYYAEDVPEFVKVGNFGDVPAEL